MIMDLSHKFSLKYLFSSRGTNSVEKTCKTVNFIQALWSFLWILLLKIKFLSFTTSNCSKIARNQASNLKLTLKWPTGQDYNPESKISIFKDR